MSDRLKEFINTNRGEFDLHEPGPGLWTTIAAGIQQPGYPIVKLKKISKMFKYGFGASALIIGTLVLLNQPSPVTKAKTTAKPATPAKIAPAVNPVSAVLEQKPVTAKSPNPVAVVSPGNFLPSVPELPPVPALPEEPAEIEPPAVNIAAWRPDTLKTEYASKIDTAFEGIKKLKVDVSNCNINVKGREGSKLSLQADIGKVNTEDRSSGKKKRSIKEQKVRISRTGDQLNVTMEAENIVGWGNYSMEVENTVLNIEVPANIDVEIDNDSGKITAQDLGGKTLKLKTQFGNIDAYNISSGLNARSTSGHISLREIKGDVTAKCDFGNQILEDIKGNVSLNSSSGRITIKNLKGNADMKTSFGDQRVDSIVGNIVSECASGNVSIKRMKGDINIKTSFGKQNYENVTGNIHSRSGSGGIEIKETLGMLDLNTSFGNIVVKSTRLTGNSEFRAASGNIKAEFLNEMKDLRFELESSSGNLSVNKESYKSVSDNKLTMGQGSILIRGNSTFGNQSYN